MEELDALCKRLAASANALRSGLMEDENGVFALEKDSAAEFSKIPAAYRLLGADYSIFSARYTPQRELKRPSPCHTAA
ncbi:MAG: hypothetical protein V8Q85_04545 [Christensenellales bacterium]